MPRIAERVLYRSATLSIMDSRCRDQPVAAEVAAARGFSHLVLTRRGMFVQHLGGSARNQIVVDPGTALFLNGGDIYRTTHPRGGVHDCFLLAFNPAEAAAAVAASDPTALDRGPTCFVQRHGPLPPMLAFTAHRLRVGLRGGVLETDAVEELSLTLVAAAAAAARRPHGRQAFKLATRTLRQHRDLARAVRERLAAAPTEPHPLSSLAAEFGCSMFHLARVFRTHEGVPIHRYLVRLRLSLALEHLVDGAPDLARVAIGLGFASHSHFTAQFRRAYGVPPGVARAHIANVSSSVRSSAAGSSSEM